ncbi:MAG: peptidoglycan-binding domain-containing protein [Gammaproteobacteria bacterium]
MRFIVFLTVSLLLTTAVHGGDAQGRYAIKGVGAQSCADYNKARRNKLPEVYMFMGWFQGWMSNENRHRENTFDLASWQHTGTLLAALDAYCEKNEKYPFVGAAEALIASMRTSALDEQALLVTAEAGGRSVQVYDAVLARLQAALAESGDYLGAATGRFDEATGKAILAYQKREGLPETGLPDQVILQRLVHR